MTSQLNMASKKNDLKNEGNFKNEDDTKNENDLKTKMTSKKKSSLHVKEYCLQFSLMTSHGTTDIKPEMLSGVQTRNGTLYNKYNIHGIAMRAKTEKMSFSCKDD